MPVSPFVIFIVLFGFVLIMWVIVTHNNFARMGNLVRESWANVDVALKRRHDLIPNLEATVKAFAAHEENLLTEIVRLREQALSQLANLAQLRDTENDLARNMSAILARVESYPELKSSQAFLDLQTELANTEDRIAAARRFYNANVRQHNTLLESFPSSLLAGGRIPAEYFEIDSVVVREHPKVA